MLADESKWNEQLAFAYPVTLEAIRSAVKYVERRLKEMGAEVTERRTEGKTGLLVSDDGNYLLEAGFQHVDSIEKLAPGLDRMPGVVGYSLFYQTASKAVIAKTDGIEVVTAKREQRM